MLVEVAAAPSGEVVLTAFDSAGVGTPRATVDGASCLALARAVAAPDGSLVFAGVFGNAVKAPEALEPVLDPTSPSGVSCSEPSAFGVYVLEVDAQGHAMWLHTTPTTDGYDDGFVAAVSATHVAITGTLVGDLDLGTTTLSPIDGGPTPFTALLDASGAAIWSTLDVGGGRIAVGADDTVTVTGACATGMSVTGLDATGATAWDFCSPASSLASALAIAPDAKRRLRRRRAGTARTTSSARRRQRSRCSSRASSTAPLRRSICTAAPARGSTVLVATRDGVILVGENYAGFGEIDFGQGPIVGKKGQQTFLAHLVFAPSASAAAPRSRLRRGARRRRMRSASSPRATSSASATSSARLNTSVRANRPTLPEMRRGRMAPMRRMPSA